MLCTLQDGELGRQPPRGSPCYEYWGAVRDDGVGAPPPPRSSGLSPPLCKDRLLLQLERDWLVPLTVGRSVFQQAALRGLLCTRVSTGMAQLVSTLAMVRVLQGVTGAAVLSESARIPEGNTPCEGSGILLLAWLCGGVGRASGRRRLQNKCDPLKDG